MLAPALALPAGRHQTGWSSSGESQRFEKDRGLKGQSLIMAELQKAMPEKGRGGGVYAAMLIAIASCAVSVFCSHSGRGLLPAGSGE